MTKGPFNMFTTEVSRKIDQYRLSRSISIRSDQGPKGIVPLAREIVKPDCFPNMAKKS